MQPLPIDEHLQGIVEQLRSHRAVVIVAQPGAGKTTRVPPALLAANLLTDEHSRIVMLQPRRVAARAAAERIASEQGWKVGGEVGYHVRFERVLTEQTRLRVVTEGILSRQLVDDPFLTGIGAVVLDEFHERSIHSDVVIALLRDLQRSGTRDDLRIIVMSATLEADAAAKFLGDCPIIRVPGRTFAVAVEYRPTNDPLSSSELTATITEIANGDEPGDVLVFLPGAGEIRRTIASIEQSNAAADLTVVPLYGSLSSAEQSAALRPALTGKRKVVLATNIAETSLTIDGVRFVIDCGLARIATYDSQRGLDRLDLRPISQAAATQRAGRAGRTAAGRCIRLYSEKAFHALKAFELPEILRVDLCSTVLTLHASGFAEPRKFSWFTPPNEEAIVAAERLLEMLGAISPGEFKRLTKLGEAMLAMPVHPRLARLLLAARDAGMPRSGATLAALLSEKDYRLDDWRPMRRDELSRPGANRGSSDLLDRLTEFESLEARHFNGGDSIDIGAARQVARVRDDLIRLTSRGVKSESASRDEDVLLKCILAAYPDRVAFRRGDSSDRATMVGGGGVRIDPRSIVHDWPLFVAIDARHDPRSASREAIVRIASGVRPEWLGELFPGDVRRSLDVEFDEASQCVVGISRLRYHDLILQERRDAAVDSKSSQHVLATALAPRASEIISRNEAARNLIQRVEFLRGHFPKESWPIFASDTAAKIIFEACANRRSLSAVESTDLRAIVMNELPYPLDRLLEQHAPATIIAPSGQAHSIVYFANQPPTVSVRLQELFGMIESPRIANGRVPLRFELLGPNYRPVQVTDDLRSFWASAYFQVRKDLRVRYPKHSWPEDPLTATPQARGSGRRR